MFSLCLSAIPTDLIIIIIIIIIIIMAQWAWER